MVDLLTQVVEEAVVMVAHLEMLLVVVITPEAVEVDLLVVVE